MVHVGFADPFDNELRDLIFKAVDGKGVLEGQDTKLHKDGLLICMGMSTASPYTNAPLPCLHA